MNKPKCLALKNKRSQDRCPNDANPDYGYYVCGTHMGCLENFKTKITQMFEGSASLEAQSAQRQPEMQSSETEASRDMGRINEIKIISESPKEDQMQEPSNGLLNHRQQLMRNPHRYTAGKEIAFKNFAEKVYSWYYLQHCTRCQSEDHLKLRFSSRRILPLIDRLANMIFDAQDGKPLYEHTTGDGLPRAWNSPNSKAEDGTPVWNAHHIAYHIGHLISDSRGGTLEPANLSFQSARCNLHVQTGLNVKETVEYQLIPEVRSRIDSLYNLHNNALWKQMIEELNRLCFDICPSQTAAIAHS